MTKRDRPDRPMPIGNTEPCSHGILVFELAKEACTERKALYSDQHVLYRCTPIDPPIRDGPRLRALSKARRRLVRLSVAVDVCGRANVWNEQHRGVQQAWPRKPVSARYWQRRIPVCGCVIADEHQRIERLRIAGAGT